jgi:hypothetical protein
LELRNYISNLDETRKNAKKNLCKVSAATGLMFATLFLFYAYGLYVGGRLRWEEVKNGDTIYNTGSILGCMFSVIFGAF